MERMRGIVARKTFPRLTTLSKVLLGHQVQFELLHKKCTFIPPVWIGSMFTLS